MMNKCVVKDLKEYIICEPENIDDILSIVRRMKLLEEVIVNFYSNNSISAKWNETEKRLDIYLGENKADSIKQGDYLVYDFSENQLLVYSPENFHKSFIIVNEYGDKND